MSNRELLSIDSIKTSIERKRIERPIETEIILSQQFSFDELTREEKIIEIPHDEETGEIITTLPSVEEEKKKGRAGLWLTLFLALLIPLIGVFTFFMIMYETNNGTTPPPSQDNGNDGDSGNGETDGDGDYIYVTPIINPSSLSDAITYGPKIDQKLFLELFCEELMNQFVVIGDGTELNIQFDFEGNEVYVKTEYNGNEDYFVFNIKSNQV